MGNAIEKCIETHHGVDFVADGTDLWSYVGGKKRAGDDLEGEMHHLGVHVHDGAGAPLFAEFGALRSHDVGVGLDALAVEGRSRNPTLPHVEWPVAGDEALAEQDLHPALRALFYKGAPFGHQHFLDLFRLTKEQDFGAEDAIAGCGAKS